MPAKELTDVGNNRSAEAKIGGITPGTLILRGRWEESPEKILFPTCLLGYWTIIFLWDLSIKTINAITAIANTKIIIIKIGDIAPVLPCSNICAKALGNSATIPEKIINETPLPNPL